MASLTNHKTAAQGIVNGTVSDKVVDKGRYLDYTYKGITISYFADKVYKTQE